jgi:addiction module HigA family antidote
MVLEAKRLRKPLSRDGYPPIGHRRIRERCSWKSFSSRLESASPPLQSDWGISFARLNEIIRAKRGVTTDKALRLAHGLGMSADFWLGLQMDWDLWHAVRSEKAAINRLQPLHRA